MFATNKLSFNIKSKHIAIVIVVFVIVMVMVIVIIIIPCWCQAFHQYYCFCCRIFRHFWRIRSRRVVRVGATIAVHREQRVPSTDVLPDVHLVQVDLRAAQSLVVLKAHATLPHHDDNIPPKDIGALREKDAERE